MTLAAVSLALCRRERNRSTAIATHEKKKAREAALKAEVCRSLLSPALHYILQCMALARDCMLNAESHAVSPVTDPLHCCLQLSLRQGEHDALQRLLDYVQQPKADKGGLPISPTAWSPILATCGLFIHQCAVQELLRPLRCPFRIDSQ